MGNLLGQSLVGLKELQVNGQTRLDGGVEVSGPSHVNTVPIDQYLPRGVPPGGAVDITTNFAGIGAETDLTGATVGLPAGQGYIVTVPIGNGRRIRVRCYIPSITSTVAGDYGSLRLYQDGVIIQRVDKWFGNVALGQDHASERTFVPAGGVHTYKATYQRTNGTGTFSSFAGGLFTVEDIGYGL